MSVQMKTHVQRRIKKSRTKIWASYTDVSNYSNERLALKEFINACGVAQPKMYAWFSIALRVINARTDFAPTKSLAPILRKFLWKSPEGIKMI